MFKKLVLILATLFLAVSIAKGEDLLPISNMSTPSNSKVVIGVTDDANKSPMMLRTDTSGYLRTTCLGNVAHDAVDAGNPVKIGMKAVTLKTSVTPVASGDRVDWLATRQGIPFVLPGHPNTIRTGSGRVTAAQTNTVLISASATQKIVITGININVGKDVTVNPSFLIGFAPQATGVIPSNGAGVVFDHPAFSPGDTVAIGGGAGILAIGDLDEDLRVTTTVATGGYVTITISYILLTDN